LARNFDKKNLDQVSISAQILQRSIRLSIFLPFPFLPQLYPQHSEIVENPENSPKDSEISKEAQS
jgi:hypothetical protein